MKFDYTYENERDQYTVTSDKGVRVVLYTEENDDEPDTVQRVAIHSDTFDWEDLEPDSFDTLGDVFMSFGGQVLSIQNLIWKLEGQMDQYWNEERHERYVAGCCDV